MPACGEIAKQTEATLLAIQRTLERLTSDVVKMTIFLVGASGAGGRVDFDGFMRSYRKFYGTADVQLQRPGRPEEPVSGRGKVTDRSEALCLLAGVDHRANKAGEAGVQRLHYGPVNKC